MRLGIVIPSPNTVAEKEAPQLLPAGISAHYARFKVQDVTNLEQRIKDFSLAEERIWEAVEQLLDIRPSAIAIACTIKSIVTHEGELEDTLCRKITAKTGIPCISSADAIILALRQLSLKKICLVTPYAHSVASREIKLFKGALPGLEIPGRYDMGIVEGFAKGLVSEEETLAAICSVFREEWDGIVISCTNLSTLGLIAKVEEKTGRPVITSLQATIWASLLAMGLKEEKKQVIKGGFLFTGC